MGDHLLLSPHNDDEVLFAAYTALRYQPLVLTCWDGARKTHLATVEERVAESMAAAEVLGYEYGHLWVDLEAAGAYETIERRIRLGLGGAEPEHVWAPYPEPGGHRHHNGLGYLATRMWPGRVSFYATYTCEHDETGEIVGVHRSKVGEQVAVEDRHWPELKRKALRCFYSQRTRQGTAMHFRQPLDEWVVPTLRLNLGGGYNPIPGYVNLDKQNGWLFEDGLPEIGTGSVEAITESHALMYVPEQCWPAVFDEIARVLAPGGWVRFTHDATSDPASGRQGLRRGAEVATTPDLILSHLYRVGIWAEQVQPDETRFGDRSLIQQNYGSPPDVFHIEGRKEPV